jgi:hypothetical protein
MGAVILSLAVVLSASTAAIAPQAEGPGISLSASAAQRSASLLDGVSLAASWKMSAAASPLRLTDNVRLEQQQWPQALDQGGGVSSDVRQILALILGFIPGFGIGHLVARDRDGFILFLVIDAALYVAWVVVGSVFRGFFWGLGGAVWLVVHVIQALDAYAEAGGERFVQMVREQAVEVAGRSRANEGAVITTRAMSFSF